MAYTIIPDGDIDPDSPITTGLMTAYRDNTTEVAEGASGPRIHPSSALDDTITTDGSQSIGSGATWTPAQGFYNMTTLGLSTAGRLELFISAAWRNGLTSVSGLVFFDGVNMRLKNGGASAQSTYWQRFDG